MTTLPLTVPLLATPFVTGPPAAALCAALNAACAGSETLVLGPLPRLMLPSVAGSPNTAPAAVVSE